jgi:hypothetical protein
VLGDGVEQGHGLQRVARGARAGVLADLAGVDRVLHRGHDQLDAEVGDRAVTELDDLVEVVAGVDVHHRERDARRPERPVGQVEHHDGVLAAREEQHGTLALGSDLPEDRDGFVLELGGARQGGQAWGLGGRDGGGARHVGEVSRNSRQS